MDGEDSTSEDPGLRPPPGAPISRATTSSSPPIVTGARGGSGMEAKEDTEDPLEAALSSVVKVFCTSAPPNYYVPWQIVPQTSSKSSGFVVRNRRIICNAHGITDHVFIRVRKHGDATKYRAKLIAVGHDCDLAMITVENDKFWEGLLPLEFGDLPPSLQASVVVIGYPRGGDCICVTKGVVSRVVVTSVSHSHRMLLTIQIDAAINPGNSGGPAMQGKTVAGVAFQGLTKSQNIGYIIPASAVKKFISDVDKHGSFAGLPTVGVKWQCLENESMRRALKVPNDNEGILINAIEPLAPCAGVLKVDDVIRKIDGVAVAGDGSIFFRRGERVSYVHLITQKRKGESVTCEIMREGKTLEVDVALADPKRYHLVPVNLYDTLPSYFVYAGLVFTVLSRPYLYSWGSSWTKKAPSYLVQLALHGVREKEDQEIVVLNQILAAPCNVNYERISFRAVVSVNGTKVHNLKHLVELVESAEAKDETFIRFQLMREKVLVVETKLAQRDSKDILRRNQIAHDRSADLRSEAKGVAERIRKAKTRDEISQLLHESKANNTEISGIVFDAMDSDGSEALEIEEFFGHFEREWGFAKEMVVDLFKSFDKDSDGTISREEFCKFFVSQFKGTDRVSFIKLATNLAGASMGIKKQEK